MTPHVCHLVEVYHDRLLDAETARVFEEHLATCAQCRTELEEVRALDDEVARAWLDVPAPASLTSVTPASAIRERNRTLSQRYWPVVAAVLVLASAALAWSLNRDRGDRIVRITGEAEAGHAMESRKTTDSGHEPAPVAPVAMRGSTPLYASAEFSRRTPGAALHSSPELTVFVAFPNNVTRPLTDKE